MRPLRIIPAMLILGLLAPGTATAEDDPLNINVEEALYHQCKEMEDQGIAFARECWAVHELVTCDWVAMDEDGASRPTIVPYLNELPSFAVEVGVGTAMLRGPQATASFKYDPNGVKCAE